MSLGVSAALQCILKETYRRVRELLDAPKGRGGFLGRGRWGRGGAEGTEGSERRGGGDRKGELGWAELR